MLCDYLIADKTLKLSYDGLDKVFRKIILAQKFILTKEFSIAADGLVDNIPELVKIVPYCRLPFPLMWVEWVHDDRPHWDVTGPYEARPVDKSRHQAAPARCGFLLEQHSSTAFRAHLFWSLKEIPDGCATEYNGSLAALDIDISRGLEDLPRFTTADFGIGLLSSIPLDVVKQLGSYALEDWGGEMRFLVAMLGLLNTRNVVQMEEVNKDKHNVKRIKQGKLPLFSHKLLKIRHTMMRSASSGSAEHQHRDLRLHFVSGHFKVRKSGVFWWNMHARGMGAKGFIDKDYEV
jgi:hypothetical protein